MFFKQYLFLSPIRAYLQNGGVSYRHDAPMLNDKYFPKDAYGGSNAYLGQTNVSIVPHGGMVTNGQGEYDGFKYPHLQLRNVSLDVRREYKKFERILDGISMETRGGELVAIMSTKRKLRLIFSSQRLVDVKLHRVLLNLNIVACITKYSKAHERFYIK